MQLFRLILHAKRSLPRLLPLMRSAAVPGWIKAGTVAAAVLVVSPIDLLSDIPILGIFDDVALLAMLVNLFVWLAERSIARAPSATSAQSSQGTLVALNR